MTDVEPSEKTPAKDLDDRTIRLLLHALRDPRFGQVTVIVQDGVVVQIERTEKQRLNRKTKCS